ncbi:hypothetical protein [Streptomyces cinereoruber]|uniref:hypothetical protein n=1 Tax=Streptomyces cinereoruber TaxID=67260 RepID=UPI00363AEC6B
MNEWAPDVPLAVRSELPPYGIKPHWVTFAFSAQANRLYDLYNAHVNRDRGDLMVWPTLEDLAEMMGLSRSDKASPYMRELEAGGAIEVDTVTKTGGNGKRYIVTLKVHPPAAYRGPLQSSDWHRAHKAAQPHTPTMMERARGVNSKKTAGQNTPPAEGEDRPDVPPAEGDKVREDVNSKETAGQKVPPVEGGDVPPPEGGDVPPLEGGVTSNQLNQNNQEQQTAPSARSATDARRATTGSSAREAEGGSAASKDKSSAAKGKGRSGVRMSRTQADAVRTVEAGLPGDLVALLPRYRPAVVRDAILAAVSGRTAEQIVARVERRWLAWGYSLKAMDGEIKSPVGVLVRLLERNKCGDPMCEDGTALDTGAACRECEVRRADRRQKFKRSKGEGVPTQRPAAGRETWVCVDCERPGPGQAPADGVCRDCTAAVAASAAAFGERLAREAEQKKAAAEAEQRRAAELAAAMEREHQEQAEAKAAEEAARLAAEQERAAETDEETARLRAQLLAENPWMAAYATKPPQEAAAPF